MGKGHILKPPPKTGREGFHRVLLNHHQFKPLPFQEHAIPLTAVFFRKRLPPSLGQFRNNSPYFALSSKPNMPKP